MEIAGLQFSWVDWAALGLLLVSMVVGVVRGLVFEIFSLLGWGVAYFGAQWATPVLMPYLPLGASGSAVNRVASFVCAFILILIVWGLVSRLVRMLIHASALSPLDRALGLGFGFARGMLVLLVITTVAGLTPVNSSQAWQQSRAQVWLNVVLNGLEPLLPDEVSLHLLRTTSCAELLA